MTPRLVLILWLALFAPPAAAVVDVAEDCSGVSPGPEDAPASSPEGHPEVGFALKFQDEVSPYRLISTTVEPGETLTVEALLTDRDARFEARSDGGALTREGPERWRWHAPEAPGTHCIAVRDVRADETACLRVFVTVPYSGADEVQGYRIGRYERVPLAGDPAYGIPGGLVRVTDQNRDTWVSPHFQLRQFVAKQQAEPPRFLVLQTRLLLKLEMLLEKFREAGIEADTLHVMSGYRTPFYNRSIGNRTKYSRHLYGDAADVFVDTDGDDRMDDLDRDGDVDVEDARVLYRIVEGLDGEAWYAPFVGGLGLYGPAPHRGPFIHVDTRGRAVRW